MSSLNKVIIIGRLGTDPELRYTQANTAVCNVNVATSDRYKDKNGEYQESVEWHKVVLWGKTAETVSEYLKKGSLACFEGKLSTREWEDKEGIKRYTTEITAYNMVMLGSKDDSPGGNTNRPKKNQSRGGHQPPPSPVQSDSNFDDLDDDLPF